MDCPVVRDLLPLYMNNSCSEESVNLIEEHLKNCPDCRAVLEDMKETHAAVSASSELSAKSRRMNDWKLALLPSCLFIGCFFIIVVGVTFEIHTYAQWFF